MNKNVAIREYLKVLEDVGELTDAIDYYTSNYNKNYLIFIEEHAIKEMGENIWVNYIKERLLKLNEDHKFMGKKMSPNIVSIEIFKKSSHNGKWKICYPKLYAILEDGLKLFKESANMNKGFRMSLESILAEYNNMSDIEITKLIEHYIENVFMNKRLKLEKLKLFQSLLDSPDLKHFEWIKPSLRGSRAGIVMERVVDDAIINQEHVLIRDNRKEINTIKDKWTLYYKKGLSLQYCAFDFSEIESIYLKRECQMFLRDEYNGDNIQYMSDKYGCLRSALVRLQNEFNTERLADIDSVQMGILVQRLQLDKNIAPSTMSLYRTALSDLSDYLISLDKYGYKPSFNVFNKVSFYNVSNMKKNTEYIPDDVAMKIDEHIADMPIHFSLAYKMFSVTGMRSKEIFHITYPCCDYTEEKDGYVKLIFNQHKVKLQSRRRGVSEEDFVFIEKSLAKEIDVYATIESGVRRGLKIPYLFINKRDGNINLYTGDAFAVAINKIIKKYDIRDNTGKLWLFSPRQTRKTLAVNLIDSGAPTHVVSKQLGHINQKTTQKYYTEVKLMKLAEMDSLFFR